MISETSGRPVRLGYMSTAGRFELSREDLRRGISILGHGADDVATLMAYACDEAGLKTLVLDLGGQGLAEALGIRRLLRAPTLPV